jgi:hypothetical protein
LSENTQSSSTFPRTNLTNDTLLSRKKVLRTRRFIKRTVLCSEGTQRKEELATYVSLFNDIPTNLDYKDWNYWMTVKNKLGTLWNEAAMA